MDVARHANLHCQSTSLECPPRCVLLGPQQPPPPASFSKALDDALSFLGLVVQLSEGVKQLLHLPLQRSVAQFRGGPGLLGLCDLGLDDLVPVALLHEVGFQPDHLHLQLLVPLLEAGGAEGSERQAASPGCVTLRH